MKKLQCRVPGLTLHPCAVMSLAPSMVAAVLSAWELAHSAVGLHQAGGSNGGACLQDSLPTSTLGLRKLSCYASVFSLLSISYLGPINKCQRTGVSHAGHSPECPLIFCFKQVKFRAEPIRLSGGYLPTLF